MTAQINLKEIERKAFRATYQDGLWDMYYGLIVVCMSVFIYRPAEGYSLANILLMLAGLLLAYMLFWAGKKFLTVPRMGQVRFGEARRKRKTTMAIVLGAVVLVQVGVVVLTVLAWFNPAGIGAWVGGLVGGGNLELLVVAAVGSLFVGVGMLVTVYFSDFPRGFYIAVLMALAVFLMIYLNQPLYPVLIGALIFLPGLVLFVRFLKMYPLPAAEPGEASNE